MEEPVIPRRRRLAKGDVVVIPFPFSNLHAAKRRPALVLASAHGDDVILCEITSRANQDRYAVLLTPSDFGDGALPVTSHIRPDKLFTADQSLILNIVGSIKEEKLRQVHVRLKQLFFTT